MSTAVTVVAAVTSAPMVAASVTSAPMVVATLPSVSGAPAVAAPSAPFDVRLIPEFDGSTDVVEWFSRAKMLCQLRGVAAEMVLPLRLSGGAFSVWSQLPVDSRCSLLAVRRDLYTAFALDKYAAYEAFSSRRLQAG